MPVTFNEFKQAHSEQGISFHGRMTQLALAGIDYTIPMMLGDLSGSLRRGPTPLISEALDPSLWKDDTAATALQKILNATVEPVDDPNIRNFTCKNPKILGSCAEAEYGFTHVLMKMSDTANRNSRFRRGAPIGADIFFDEGKPLFVRKGHGEPSALSLAEVSVNGIPFPAGSIFRLDTHDDIEMGYHNVEKRIQTFDVGEIAKLSFLRPSAWIYSSKNEKDAYMRSLLLTWSLSKPDVLQFANKLDLEAIGQIAIQAIGSEARTVSAKLEKLAHATGIAGRAVFDELAEQPGV